MDENGKINRLEDTALKIAKIAGIDLALGGTMTDDDKDKFSTGVVRFAFRSSGARQAFGRRWKIFC